MDATRIKMINEAILGLASHDYFEPLCVSGENDELDEISVNLNNLMISLNKSETAREYDETELMRVRDDFRWQSEELKARNEELEEYAKLLTLKNQEIDNGAKVLRQANEQLQLEIEQRIMAEKEAERIRMELMTVSRMAGMAEVATSVLHNVGNVLNSVNVSATLIGEKIRRSKVNGLTKAVGLINDHRSDLATFFLLDAKGTQLPVYLETLARSLLEEQAQVLEEIASLTKNIAHIKEVVSLQQNHAKRAEIVEKLSLAELIDDAIKFNAGSLRRHDINIVKNYHAPEFIHSEKHKLLQVLVNLVSNAKHALKGSSADPKEIIIQTFTNGNDRLCIEIKDNGIGIPRENLSKIFVSGYTTKKDGHGFGLHYSALAAKELGGTLIVHSDGPGQGATATIELPYPSRSNK